MARPNRIKEIAAERGMEPEILVAKALRQGRTIKRARKIIGVSYQALWRFVDARRDVFVHDCGWTYKGNVVEGEIIDNAAEQEN